MIDCNICKHKENYDYCIECKHGESADGLWVYLMKILTKWQQ